MLWSAVAGIVGVGTFVTYYAIPWLKDDLSYCLKFFKLLKAYLAIVKAKLFVVDQFEASVKRNPKKTFLWHDGVAYSYSQVDDEATKVARFAEEIGLKPGDTIAMMIFNSPEFVWTYIGFMKLGIRAALLNTNIRSKSLQHCLAISGAKIVIFGKDLLEAIESIPDYLKSEGYSVWIQGPEVPSAYQSMDDLMSRLIPKPINPNVRSSITMDDPVVYIYTSGTTGLPKAAVVTHKRLCSGTVLMPNVCHVTSNDVIYLTMPLYHSSALFIGLGGTIQAGATGVLRKKFSASAFWEDCRKYDVTCFIYIGELCRYLVNRPPQSNDKDNKVRVVVGNGLRPEIWETFRDRFGIHEIREFYSATEGLGFLTNMGDIPGSVGRCSPLLRKIYPMDFLKFDYEKEAPYRGSDGKCVQAKPGETGLFVSAIRPGKFDFDGYRGKKETTEKKLLRNVYKEGDAYYNSGDLLKCDEMYNVYFVDRVGDTFRWKGENVSTTEVAAVLSEDEKVFHVNVYGVEIPNCDGRAGMAALTMNQNECPTEEFLSNLYKNIVEYLPIYARPLFLRIQMETEQTSTFKYVKTNLQREGFNPHEIKEGLFRLDSSKGTYSSLDGDFYDGVCAGKIKL